MFVCNASHFRQLGLIWPMMWQKWHFKCPWLTSLACGLNGWSPGVALPLVDGLPLPLGNPFPLSPLPLPFGLPFPLPLPFDLPLSFRFPLVVWYGPGEVKLVAGSCKYVQDRCFVSCTFCLLTCPLPFPFGNWLVKVCIIACRLALVFKYCIIRGCSWGVYLLVKLVTFLASNLTNSANTYSPWCTLTAVNVKFALRVAMISFSSSVICFATTRFILIILPLDILSFTVSA